jgi:hypothetical protein
MDPDRPAGHSKGQTDRTTNPPGRAGHKDGLILVDLVHSVCLVDLVYLVCLVCLVCLVSLDQETKETR